MKTLKTLFLAELADRYDAEKQLVHALPKIVKTTTCESLQTILQSHFVKTVGFVSRLDEVFNTFGEIAKTKKSEATAGLLREAAAIASEFRGSTALNAALIRVAQKIAHNAIVSYGSLCEWAALLGDLETSALLHSILEEQRATNQALIELAHSRSNVEAMGKHPKPHRTHAALPLHGRRAVRPMKLHLGRRALISSR